jgi:hypothetical protein
VSEYLKGNYKVDTKIASKDEAEAGATDAFERTALSRLGGSICFVSKKSFVWKGDDKTDGAGTPSGPGA